MARRRQPGLKGIDNVMRNINKELLKMKAKSVPGMLEAAAFIRRDMEKVPPLIPVDSGNLRASWFTTPLRNGVVMGFTAGYAVIVHEFDMSRDINWSRPGSGPKFLESALIRNKDNILRIMANRMKI